MNGGGYWIFDANSTAGAGDWQPFMSNETAARWRDAYEGIRDAIQGLVDRVAEILAPLVGYGIAARPKPRRWFNPDPPASSAMLFAAHRPAEVHIPPHPRARAPPALQLTPVL